ncbi:MAG: ribose-phosphate pyrophosphokinase [Pseudomonadales bacterium]|nr:ribose-phosphate pyrophosphokinase [Pseudomonadales bacterium]
MRRILFVLPGQEELGASLQSLGSFEQGVLELRHFPDGESYVRVDSEVRGAQVLILCQLHHPDDKILPLLLLVGTLRDLGAHSIGLVAPYLAYMRQDKRFHAGEGISARYFARLLSQQFDWLLTVDPHLHRIHALSEVYSMPALALTAVEPIAQWLRSQVQRPLIIGPDGESEQWARKVATAAGCPCEVLTKERFGDREVKVSLPHVTEYLDRTPVLVDDIISTGRTMQQAAAHLRASGMSAPVCIGVHGIFAPGAREEMEAAGLRVVTSNSISDPSNRIDLAPLLMLGLHQLLK